MQLDQNSDLVEHGAAEGGPDGQPEDTDLGRAEAAQQCPVCHLGGRAVASCHAMVKPEPNPVLIDGIHVSKTSTAALHMTAQDDEEKQESKQPQRLEVSMCIPRRVAGVEVGDDGDEGHLGV